MSTLSFVSFTVCIIVAIPFDVFVLFGFYGTSTQYMSYGADDILESVN